jgi:hypothetical protein
MLARRSVLALLTAATLVAGAVTSSSSHATAPVASPTPTPTSPAATGPSHLGPTLKPFRDTAPPAPVTDLRMTSNDARSISLSWINPTDSDFAGVLIRRAAGDTPPISAADGTLVAALSSRQTTFSDKHLSAASTYSYAVFSRDKSRNVGLAATVTTETRSTSSTTGLRGKLTDKQGRAISRVQVEVREPSTGNWVGFAVTTATGQFSVTGLAPGAFSVCFRPDSETSGHSSTGYLPGCYRQQPYGYGDAGTPVTVLAGKMTSGLVDYLLTAGALSGRVTDPAGRGLSDVTVIVLGRDDFQQVFSTSTGADGSYTTTGLAAGSYEVCFYSLHAGGPSTTGYLDECYDDQPPYSSGTPIAVRSGQTSAGVDAVLAVAGAITGKVTDPSGSPLQDVMISASGARYGGSISDSGGDYAITGLASDSYLLCFDGSYLVSATAPYGYTNTCVGDRLLRVDVVAGQATTVNETLFKAGAVGGAVTSDDGPVAGVMVVVSDSSGRMLTMTATNDDGTYQLAGLEPGQVTVCFDPTYTSGAYLRTCYGAQADGSGSLLTITAGELRTVDVQLSRGASITGTITDASGAPISGVLVSAFGSVGFNGYSGQTDEFGSYTLSGLAADAYKVCFDPSYAQGPTAGGYAAQCYDNQPSFDTADPVTVGSSGSLTVNAVLGSGAAITGLLTGSDGAALGGVFAYAYAPESGQYITVVSDHQDGSYRLAGLTEGDYLVCFGAGSVQQPSTTGYVDECYENQRTSYTATPVHVSTGTVTTGIDAELAVGAAITGRVTDSAGNGLGDVYVETTLAGDNASSGSLGVTDDTGRYRLIGLPATAVSVCFFAGEGLATSGTGYTSECYDDQPDVSTATQVSTTAGEVSAGIDAELAAGAAITGQVTDSAGNPVPNVYVHTFGADGWQLTRYAFTDDTGHYRLTSLPATAVSVCFQSNDGGANGNGHLYECYDDQPNVSTANPVTTTAAAVSAGVNAVLADAPAA